MTDELTVNLSPTSIVPPSFWKDIEDQLCTRKTGSDPFVTFHSIKELDKGDLELTVVIVPRNGERGSIPESVLRKRILLECQQSIFERLRKVLIDDFGYSERFFDKIVEELDKVKLA